jgi:hypothetical protein
MIFYELINMLSAVHQIEVLTHFGACDEKED